MVCTLVLFWLTSETEWFMQTQQSNIKIMIRSVERWMNYMCRCISRYLPRFIFIEQYTTNIYRANVTTCSATIKLVIIFLTFSYKTYFCIQLAAVNTHWSLIKLPPQVIFSFIIRTCHGNNPGMATDPFIIRISLLKKSAF